MDELHGFDNKNNKPKKTGRIIDDGQDVFSSSKKDRSYGYSSDFYPEKKTAKDDAFDFSDFKLDIDTQSSSNNYYDFDDFDYNKSNRPVKNKPVKNKPKKKKSGKKLAVKIILALFLLTVIASIGAFAYFYNIMGNINYLPETHLDNEFIADNKLMSSDEIYNVLILGTDERETEENYRSDSMILVSIDKKSKKITLTSFLRDSWVYIPAKDYHDKLNAACSYGGAQMVIDTIEYNYHIKIDNYVMVNFQIFRTIVKDLGYIELDITQAEADCINNETGWAKKTKAGLQKVHDAKALWYVRIRHLDSDFNRTSRQRKAIEAIVKRIKEVSPSVWVQILNDVLPQIQTDISKNQVIRLGSEALLSGYLNYDIEQIQVPMEGSWSNDWAGNQQIIAINFDKNIENLKSSIYGK